MTGARKPRSAYSTITIVSGSLALLLATLVAGAQASEDFRVNDTIEGSQHYGDVAIDADGGFLVVYTSPIDPDDDFYTQVLGKRYDADGDASSGEILLSHEEELATQRDGRACHRPGGGWVLVYHSQSYDPSPVVALIEREGAFARFLAEDGTPSSAEFRLSSPIASSQGASDLDVACLPDGGFFAAWGSSDQDGSYYGVFGRRVDAAGAPVGGEIQVNTETEGEQGNFGGVEVEAGPGGTVLVMWSSNCPVAFMGSIACPVEPDGSASSAQARLFDAAGVPKGDEFRLNSTTLGTQGSFGLAAAFDADDSFLAVYYSGDLALCQGWLPCGDLLGQRFDSSGTPVGPEFQISSAPGGLELHPAVAPNGQGGYLVVWQDPGKSAAAKPDEIRGRHFDALGAPLSKDFRVTSGEPGDDRSPMIAGRDGRYVVAWIAFGSVWGEGRDVAARTLSSALPECAPEPSASCYAEDSSKLSIRSDATGGTLLWKWAAKAETAVADAPGGTLGAALCIYDQDDLLVGGIAEPLARCGKRSCWSGRRGAVKYRRKEGEPFAIRSLKLKTKPKRTRIRVKAGGDSPIPALADVSAPLLAELVTNEGDCWQVEYDAVKTTSNSLRATSK